VLLEKHWRVALSRTVVDVLLEEVRKHKVIEDVPPVIATGKHYLFSVFHRGLFYLAVTSGEVPPAHVIDFIHQLLRVLGTYLGQFTESHLAENFVTVYQLLEEMLDFGYPMLTEPNILTTLIRPPTVASRVVSFVTGKGSVGDTIGAGATSMIPWRKSDVTYTQNEITFDVIEEIDCIVGRNGQVVATDAFGKVRCNCKLSGTPDALLLFRETNFAADPAFHRCVRYSRWQKDKVLSFIPPDGQFQLMRYRVNTRSIEQPVYCRPQVSYADGHGRLTVAVGAKPIRVFAASTKVKPGAAGGAGGGPEVNDVAVTLVFPRAVTNIDLHPSTGGLHYDPKTNTARWTIGRMPMEAPRLEGRLLLKPGAPPPEEELITRMSFRVSGTSVSGISVAKFTVSGVAYVPYKGVRTSVASGMWQVRS